MKQSWLFLALLVVLTRSFVVDNASDSCSEEEEEETDNTKVKCPKHYIGFYRTPNDANNQTKLWCLRAVMSNEPVSQARAQEACEAEGSVLSTFANFDEQKYIVKRATKHFNHRNITNGSLWLDGARIDECQTFDITKQTSAPCNDKKQVFRLIDPRTDPKYVWTQWYRTSPTWAYYPFRTEDYVTYPTADSVIADCIQMWISPRNSDRNGQLHSLNCDMAVAPAKINEPLYTNYGFVCGRPPVLSFY
uniref:C-type lectin domain-containing protein n=1 Tax=Caenorhabditis japonica TaxID=281687 RepID=A0A8R1DST2_CAEJA